MTRRLTVLQLLPALESGGVERGTLEIADALVKRGHRALVMSAGGRLVAPLEALGAEHLAWPVGKKSLATLALIPKLRRHLVEARVDILHARSRLPAWIAYLAWRGMAPATRPRFVTTVHGLYRAGGYGRVMARGEAVIAVSETAKNWVAEHAPDALPRVTVIPRGVDGAAYPYGWQPDAAWREAFFAAFPDARGKTLLTLPGRITRLKGHEGFFELIAALKARGLPVHGLVAGGAAAKKQAYLDELHVRVDALGLGADITFTGQRDDLKAVLAVSTLVLSLSSQPESFGRTTLEALRLGVPVAGLAHGGVGEILSAIYPAGKLPPDGDLVAPVAALLADLPRVPEGDFFPLSAMCDATLALYEALAR